ncbi:MAG: pyruvate kinase [Candidatus Niyogibacteria bacterium RIFCSPLOWO2_12_FULL_41_13]|uniref:Pyruvate kinase n=2 Tax=Parcubacteria group TaxID=1794811 RepID=A0A1G2F4K4_9BACT|nr:MAG: pyruvate kinase [Candidatus Niyogibacteria bacterium RIFCSPLOWO2_12_FULL_41_13]
MTNFFKKVKIVATLGPASESGKMILKLAKSGVDVFRINLSHATDEEIKSRLINIKRASKTLGRPLAVLADLAGIKIRIGKIAPDSKIKNGESVRISSRQIMGSGKEFSVNFPKILENIPLGADIYLGDGALKLKVRRKIKDGAIAEVIKGGNLISGMGFSANTINLANFTLSAKDKNDISKMAEAGIDAIAVSFVMGKKDIEAVKKLLPAKNRPLVIAKIETDSSVKNAEEIIKTADGVMIARGDLGLSVPLAELPHIQKSLIALSLKYAKPVITATQMLESMTNNLMPTRAEVTDVANAILDGTDAVMLSGETATGKYPEEVVKMMSEIIEEADQKVSFREFSEENEIADAVSDSVTHLAEKVGAKLILVFTKSGFTARKIARRRPHQPIIAISPERKTIGKLNFTWGVYPLFGKVHKNFYQIVEEAKKIARDNPVLKLKKGESFVISAGIPFGKSGATNLALVEKV